MYDRIVDHSLVHSTSPESGNRQHQRSVHSSIDQVQIALAIADESMLKTVLTACLPAIAPQHQIGHVSSVIGVRVPSGDTVDAVLSFDHITCVLADDGSSIEPFSPCLGKNAVDCRREISYLTRCESDLQTFVHHMPLGETLAILSHCGFSSSQIQAILHLPQDGWYKTWWYMLDDSGEFTVPFHRCIRTRHYPDGALTIQYKDRFPETKPPCFKSERMRVLVFILREDQRFSEVVSAVNCSRDQLGIHHAVLIGDRLSELEARGFLSQQVSLYTATDLPVYTRADCMICANDDCPMYQQSDSPVMTCRKFCVSDWL